jgi:hypothetical protein
MPLFISLAKKTKLILYQVLTIKVYNGINIRNAEITYFFDSKDIIKY